MNARSDTLGHITKFAVVGMSNFVIGYVIFILLYTHVFTTSAFLSQLICYVVGATWSYHWNKRWTFGSNEGSKKEFAAFMILQLSLMFLSGAMIGFAVDYMNYQPTISWFTISILITLLNFTISKKILMDKND